MLVGSTWLASYRDWVILPDPRGVLPVGEHGLLIVAVAHSDGDVAQAGEGRGTVILPGGKKKEREH